MGKRRKNEERDELNKSADKTSGPEGFLAALRSEKPDPFWILNSVFVTALAGFLRFYWLDLKPLHHDEGVNGHFLTKLFRDNFYQYDPSNYHGPDLYYFSLAFAKLFGLNTVSVRASVALFGVLTVVLILFLKKYLGKNGALAAAVIMALSPGMVFISRYFIHEIIFVFFSLGFVVSIVFFIERRNAGIFAAAWMTLLMFVCFLPPALRLPGMILEGTGLWPWILQIVIFATEAVLIFLVMRMLVFWNSGRPIYLLLASASLVFMFATKETAFITIGTMLIAWICVALWEKVMSGEWVKARRGFLLTAVQVLLVVSAAGYYFRKDEDVKRFVSDVKDFFVPANGPDQSSVFYLAILLIAVAALTWIVFFFKDIRQSRDKDELAIEARTGPTFRGFLDALGDRIDVLLVSAACAFVFIYVGILFFSSFFTYPAGIAGAFEAYAIWTKTGSIAHTQNGVTAFLRWMLEIESPIIVLALLGAAIAVLRNRSRFAVFTGLWAFGLFAAYTIIPYKTPWLALSFLLPMCISAGHAIGELARSGERFLRIAAVILAIASVSVLGYQTYNLNFVRYDDERMPYVYAHTRRGFLDLLTEVDRVAEASPAKMDAVIDIVSPDYWPMPWYLNDYPNSVFHGQLTDSSTAEMIIGSKSQRNELARRYGADYRFEGSYPLRPGVDLLLMVRKDIRVTGGRRNRGDIR